MGGSLSLSLTSHYLIVQAHLSSKCLQNWAGPPSWQQLKPLTKVTQAWEPGPS